jgi:hypothetical protein
MPSALDLQIREPTYEGSKNKNTNTYISIYVICTLNSVYFLLRIIVVVAKFGFTVVAITRCMNVRNIVSYELENSFFPCMVSSVNNDVISMCVFDL